MGAVGPALAAWGELRLTCCGLSSENSPGKRAEVVGTRGPGRAILWGGHQVVVRNFRGERSWEDSFPMEGISKLGFEG